MEPVWVLLRCYRTIPNAACNILGVYHSAGSAIADAEERQSISIDDWKPSSTGAVDWTVDDQVYTYKLESFMVPATPEPLDSIEIDTVH